MLLGKKMMEIDTEEDTSLYTTSLYAADKMDFERDSDQQSTQPTNTDKANLVDLPKHPTAIYMYEDNLSIKGKNFK